MVWVPQCAKNTAYFFSSPFEIGLKVKGEVYANNITDNGGTRKTVDGKFVSADVDNGVYHFSFPEDRGNIGQDIYLAIPAYYSDPLSTINAYMGEGG